MHRRVVFYHDAKLSMITIVRPRIVLEGVYRTVADCANRAPIEIAEIDDQVRRHSITFTVNVLRLKDGCADVYAVWVYQSLKFCLQFVPYSFNFTCFHDPLWFAPL